MEDTRLGGRKFVRVVPLCIIDISLSKNRFAAKLVPSPISSPFNDFGALGTRFSRSPWILKFNFVNLYLLCLSSYNFIEKTWRRRNYSFLESGVTEFKKKMGGVTELGTPWNPPSYRQTFFYFVTLFCKLQHPAPIFVISADSAIQLFSSPSTLRRNRNLVKSFLQLAASWWAFFVIQKQENSKSKITFYAKKRSK